MTRDILIYGSICPISLDMVDANAEIVKGIDEDYAKRTNLNVRIDVLPGNEKGSAQFVFLFDGDNKHENINPNYVSDIQAYIITGDHGEEELPYPFIGDMKYKKKYTTDYFGKMWRKNSDAMGGDPFVLKNIWYSANGMYVLVKFEV